MSHLDNRTGLIIVRYFTREELKKFDGRDGISYVAYKRRVYDVSGSFHWRNGRHHFRHRAGHDLTKALEQAPHGIEMLKKFPVVGRLVEPPVR
jgi:predicted heme/steroid binding protein